MVEQAKIKHHFVPAFYLKGFAESVDDRLVWVYSKDSNKIFCNKPENIALEKHYHTFERPDGTKDTNSIEDYLCHVWEGPTAKIIESIKAGNLPAGDDRRFFASFLGLSFTRSPNHRANVERIITHLTKTVGQISAENPEHFAQTLRKFEHDTGEKLTDDPVDLRSFILEGEYNSSMRPERYLKMFVGHGIRIGLVIEKMHWIFVRSTDRFRFLTSDNPFFFYDPSVNNQSFYKGSGLLKEKVEVSFPISQDLTLVAVWSEKMTEGYLQANHELVKVINRRSVLAADRFIYAPEKSSAIFRLVQKYAKNRPSLVIE